MKVEKICHYKELNYVDNIRFMLFTNNIHFFFQLMYMYTYYILTMQYVHTVGTKMTAVCINVCMIPFNVYKTALACFDGYARASTLITDSSYSDC